MDYKEKYEQALERARKLNADNMLSDEATEEIFPELRESEEDEEEIRKVLIEVLHRLPTSALNYDAEGGYIGATKEQMLSYLEKQKKNNIPIYDKDGYTSARKKSRNSCAEETDLKEMHDKAFSNGYQFGIHEEKPLVWTSHDEGVRKEAIECLKAWEKIIPPDYLGDYQNILVWLQKELIIHTDEKEKEPRDYRKLYEEVVNSDWFKKAYAGKSLGEEDEQKEQKPISSCDIVPYIDDKIAALQDMWREEKVAFDWDDMHEMIEDVARHFYQKEQKPVEYLSKEKVFDIMKDLTNLSYSHFIPVNSNEYKQINEITEAVRSLLDYPIEQKSVENSGKELLYVSNKSYNIGYRDGKREAEQKSEWSDEEKDKLNSIERLIVNANAHGNGLIGDKEAIELQHFIRSIVKPITNIAEWSEEDEKIINFLSRLIEFQVKDDEYGFGDGRFISKQEAIKMLKSLHPQPQLELSEEDENTIQEIIGCIEQARADSHLSEDHCLRLETFLYKHYRPSWKPSEEQMRAFKSYIEDSQSKAEAAVGGWDNFDAMIHLYEQLKKL